MAMKTDIPSLSSSELKRLVQQAAKGDQNAFSQLIHYYYPSVTQLIRRYLGEEGETDDLSQEVFIRVFLALPAFRGDSQFYTWLYRIALNTLKNYSKLSTEEQKKNKKWEPLGNRGYELFLADEGSPEAYLIEAQTEEILLTTVKEMPRELALCLLLHSIHGDSYAEIAQYLGCPIGTVRSRIYRAKALIAKALELGVN